MTTRASIEEGFETLLGLGSGSGSPIEGGPEMPLGLGDGSGEGSETPLGLSFGSFVSGGGLESYERGLLDEIRSQYPWLEVIGLIDFVIEQIRVGAGIDELLAKVRQTPQYKARFPGMIRADGTRRFGTEAEYLDHEESLRNVLIDFGMFDPNQDSPYDYLAFMDNGIDPEELQNRLARYKALERSAPAIQDAFYVYGGMNVSVDDLYQAMVSPQFAQQMTSAYDEAVAKTNLDYELWITRATERGLQRATEALRNMQTLGLVTGEAVSQMLSVDPNFAREMMGALFSESVAQTRTLSLDELLATFDYAMVGSAASEAGFELPTRDRIQQFIDAGVDRARALRGYSEIAARQAGLQAFAARYREQAMDFERLEDAFVLGEAPAIGQVTRLFNQERSLGQAGGGFGRQLEGDRVVQQGRRLRG